MTDSERRGLELAKDILRREARQAADLTQRFEDLIAAVKWIAHQQAIDERRRKPRGKYIGKPR